MAFDPKGKTNKQLYEARANLVKEARTYLEANESAWSKENDAHYDAMISDTSDITAALARRENLAAIEAKRESESQLAGDIEAPKRSAQNNLPANQVMVRMGSAAGKPRYVARAVGDRGSNQYQADFEAALSSKQKYEQMEQKAALQSNDSEQAGYLLASEQFTAGILKEVDDICFIRQYAKIHTVPEAGTLGIRRRAARMNTFGWSTELTVSTADSALKYGKKVLNPSHLTGQILLSRDLVRRGGALVASEVSYEMARNSSEKMEDGYLTGNGAEQPLGVFTASTDGISTGRDVVTGSTTAILADGLIDAKYALKAQYRNNAMGACRWLFHRDAVKMISKLKDNQNQYLWLQSLREGEPDRLLNIPIDESERVPNTFTTGLYVGLLANWNYYEIADALDMELQVLYELYAQSNQIAYIGRIKTDGMPTLEEAFVRVKTS